MALRRYEHPGRFECELVIAELIDAAGPVDTAGDCETTGHYGYVLGPFDSDYIATLESDTDVTLTDEERAYLSADFVGAIVHTGAYGFVTVEYYDGDSPADRSAATARLESTWARIVDEIDAQLSEEDND